MTSSANAGSNSGSSAPSALGRRLNGVMSNALFSWPAGKSVAVWALPGVAMLDCVFAVVRP